MVLVVVSIRTERFQTDLGVRARTRNTLGEEMIGLHHSHPGLQAQKTALINEEGMINPKSNKNK